MVLRVTTFMLVIGICYYEQIICIYVLWITEIKAFSTFCRLSSSFIRCDTFRFCIDQIFLQIILISSCFLQDLLVADIFSINN